MSLQDAANYFNQRRNSPVDRGISAGRAAYEGDRAPQRSGIGPVPIADVKSSVQQAIEQAAAQRQVLADTAQKQALGLYPNTGTSAAIYNYLRGAPGAKYPVNPILAGQPGSALESSTISKPYEEATKAGSPTQAEVAKKGDAKPPISRSGYGAQAVRQPGLLDSLIGLAAPAYLGYKGYQYLSGLGGATNWANPANWELNGLNNIGTAGLPAAAEVPGVQSLLDYDPYGVQVADATAGSGLEYLPGAEATAAGAGAANLPSLSAEAGQVGYVWNGSEMMPATADQIAAASADGFWTGTAADVTAGEVAANTALAAGEAGSLSALAPYAPWLAVAALTPVGQQAIESVSNLAQDVVSGITGGLEDFGGSVQGAYEEAKNFLGLADGGAVNGISAALPRRFAEGGDTTPDNPLIPRFADTNTLGRVLDNDLVAQYDKASKAGNISKANALKKEIDYRNRMRSVQTTPMATGGLSALHYNLGGYSDGGRLLRGPGDGVSDSIPATIGKKRQPARLADGEFVVPARIVSELGNGSTEAGARKLYAMMDRIQNTRKKSIGKGKVAVNSRADKNLPA